jgi:hypothetical protein
VVLFCSPAWVWTGGEGVWLCICVVVLQSCNSCRSFLSQWMYVTSTLCIASVEFEQYPALFGGTAACNTLKAQQEVSKCPVWLHGSRHVHAPVGA